MIVNVRSDNERIKIVLLMVTYNSKDFIGKLLESIIGQDYNLSDVLLVIVDNDSRDNTYDYLANYLRKVDQNTAVNYVLIKLRRNLGFAPANNIGLRLTEWLLESLKDKIIVLLNPDTYILRRDFFKKVDLLIRTLPIVGFSTVSGKTCDIIDSVGVFVDFLGGPQEILHGVRLTSTIRESLLSKVPVVHISPCVCFAACAIRGDVIEKIGFLRNDYVIYFEDTEFCLRAWSNEIPVFVYRDFMVWHARGGTQKDNHSSMDIMRNVKGKDGVPLDIPYHFFKNQLLLTYEYLGPLKYIAKLTFYAFITMIFRYKHLVFSMLDSLRIIIRRRIKCKRLPKGLIPRNPRSWALLWTIKYFLRYPGRGLNEAIAYGAKRASFEYLKQRFIRLALGVESHYCYMP